jgi:uncharacterized protein (TIGR03067 family)
MFTAVILFALTAPADTPKEKELSAEAKKELKKLEGKWRVVKLAGGGQEVEFKDREAFFVFDGADITISSGNKTEKLRVATLDTTTDPRCVDLTEKREGRPDRTLEGVYKLDGDTLQIAHALPNVGKNRPTGFDKSTERAMVWTLTRVKE